MYIILIFCFFKNQSVWGIFKSEEQKKLEEEKKNEEKKLEEEKKQLENLLNKRYEINPRGVPKLKIEKLNNNEIQLIYNSERRNTNIEKLIINIKNHKVEIKNNQVFFNLNKETIVVELYELSVQAHGYYTPSQSPTQSPTQTQNQSPDTIDNQFSPQPTKPSQNEDNFNEQDLPHFEYDININEYSPLRSINNNDCPLKNKLIKFNNLRKIINQRILTIENLFKKRTINQQQLENIYEEHIEYFTTKLRNLCYLLNSNNHHLNNNNNVIQILIIAMNNLITMQTDYNVFKNNSVSNSLQNSNSNSSSSSNDEKNKEIERLLNNLQKVQEKNRKLELTNQDLELTKEKLSKQISDLQNLLITHQEIKKKIRESQSPARELFKQEEEKQQVEELKKQLEKSNKDLIEKIQIINEIHKKLSEMQLREENKSKNSYSIKKKLLISTIVIILYLIPIIILYYLPNIYKKFNFFKKYKLNKLTKILKICSIFYFIFISICIYKYLYL